MDYAKLENGVPSFPNRYNFKVGDTIHMYIDDASLEALGFKRVIMDSPAVELDDWHRVDYEKWVEDDTSIYREPVVSEMKGFIEVKSRCEDYLEEQLIKYANKIGWDSYDKCLLMFNSNVEEWREEARELQEYYDNCWLFYIDFSKKEWEGTSSKEIWEEFIENFPKE